MKKSLTAWGVIGIIGVALFFTSLVKAAPKIENPPFPSGVISANELNVRNGPSTDYDVVRMLKKDDKVTLLGRVDNWYVVFCDDGRVGFSLGDYIKSDESQLNTIKPATETPVPSKAPKEQAPASTNDEDVKLSTEESELLTLVNNERKNAGQGELKADAKLMKVAKLKAQDMVVNNYFSHHSPTHGSPFDMMKLNGITYKIAGENIAGNESVSGAFKAWMDSKGHKENILNGKYTHTGVCVEESQKYGKIIVQVFIQN